MSEPHEVTIGLSITDNTGSHGRQTTTLPSVCCGNHPQTGKVTIRQK